MLTESKYFLNDQYIFDPNDKSLIDQNNEDDVTWLGNNESNILLAFINRPKEVLSRDKIHELVWTSNGFHVDESSVIQAISTVRKLLKDSAKEPTFIKTIPKHGYQFIATSKKMENTEIDEFSVALNKEENDRNYRLDTIDLSQKKEANYKYHFLVNTVLPLLVLLGGFVWMISSISSKTTELYEIGRVGNIPIVSLNLNKNQYLDGPIISQCVNQYLNTADVNSEVDKIMANLTSTNDLVLNIIHKNPANSVTYKLVADKNEITALCIEGL